MRLQGLPTPSISRAATLLCAALVLTACQDQSKLLTPNTGKSETGYTTPVQRKKEFHAPAGMQLASLLGSPTPASVIVSYNGLEWVYASPCAQNGCTSGILVGKDGFRYATPAEWNMRPPLSSFSGKCAAPYFDRTWDHCDFGDGTGSAPYNGLPAGPSGTTAMVYYWDTWLVRTPVVQDQTPPVITPNVVGTLGNNGFYTSNVNVTWTVTDPESAISAKTGCANVVVSTDTNGMALSCSATSAGGTSNQSVTIKRDATAPTIGYTGNTSPYTFEAPITIICSASDAGSGLASNTCSNITGTGATVGIGSHNYSAEAVDNAGNRATAGTTVVVSDVSAPVIKPTVTGTLGNNGWYTSNVDVSWSVTDAESPVSNQNGCSATTVTTDTDGVTFTCTAESAGGSSSESVTVKRDATKPVIGYAGNDSPYTFGQNVNVSCAASDAGSGLAANTCANINSTGAALGLGDHEYNATATDNAGNTATASTTIKVIDVTPPAIGANVSGTLGANGWYTSNVNVSWSVSDPESAVSSSNGCSATSVTTDGDNFTFTCTATSAGGTDSKSVSFKRDATAPVVAYSGNAGSYTIDQNVSITCGSSDNLSAVASSTCANVSGAAYTFALGGNSFSATATDNAGNTGNGSTSFTVNVTNASLCTLTKSFVNKTGVATSLCAKLDAAASSAARGNTNAAQNQLNAYINEVSAQKDKAVSSANAATLIALANALM